MTKSSEQLIEELHHPNRDTRMKAAQTLGELENVPCVPILCELLLNDPDMWVRIDAAEALGKIKDARSVPSLIVALKCEQLIAKWEQDWKAASSIPNPQSLWHIAARKLDQLDSAESLPQLRLPPGNHLEPLTRDRAGQHSIRINDQYRICFIWQDNEPHEVEIVDYH